MACELSYINTNHPDFIGGSQAVAETMELIQKAKASERDGSQASASRPEPKPKQPGNDAAAGGMFSFFRKDSGASKPSGAPGVESLDEVPRSIPASDTPTDREHIETQIIKSLISSYFSIVRVNIQVCATCSSVGI